MLNEKLQPVRSRLDPQANRQANYQIVRDWFQGHEENLADDIEDLSFLCELPQPERTLLTYPVVGNWILQETRHFNPQTAYQESIHSLLRDLVAETRFKNPHMARLYDRGEEYNRQWDELNSCMLSNPDESNPLHELMEGIAGHANAAISELRHKETYTTDLGHGLMNPFDDFAFLTWHFGVALEHRNAQPLGLTLMLVDDAHPEMWYSRMISVGFKHEEGQQGFFYDCETALAALENGHYDVILTDIELGGGKMDGITFVERAYEIQKSKGIKPRISVFSYNNKKLEEAEERLRSRYFARSQEPKVFDQVDHNNKADFTAMNFRFYLELNLRRK